MLSFCPPSDKRVLSCDCVILRGLVLELGCSRGTLHFFSLAGCPPLWPPALGFLILSSCRLLLNIPAYTSLRATTLCEHTAAWEVCLFEAVWFAELLFDATALTVVPWHIVVLIRSTVMFDCFLSFLIVSALTFDKFTLSAFRWNWRFLLTRRIYSATPEKSSVGFVCPRAQYIWYLTKLLL